jgi:hypothetical protein
MEYDVVWDAVDEDALRDRISRLEHLVEGLMEDITALAALVPPKVRRQSDYDRKFKEWIETHVTADPYRNTSVSTLVESYARHVDPPHGDVSVVNVAIFVEMLESYMAAITHPNFMIAPLTAGASRKIYGLCLSAPRLAYATAPAITQTTANQKVVPIGRGAGIKMMAQGGFDDIPF